MEKQKFNVSGMSCSACSARVEKVVGALDGVKSVSVSLLTNSMVVEYDAPLTAKDVSKAVADAGYKATLASDKSEKKEKMNPILVMVIRLVVSIVLLIPLMYVSMGVVMWDWPLAFADDTMAIAVYELVLSLVIMVINGKFFVSGTKSLIHRAPNMDTLVSMGSAISFIYSVALMIQAAVRPEHLAHLAHNLYFESAAMILALITLGKTLEAYSKGKTTSAIKGLMNLAPKTAHVIVDGVEKEIPVSDLQENDLFVVRPGENFAADGEIVSGNTSVNESSVTGESMPVEKAIGSQVISGTTNINGFVTVKAKKVGENTTLAGIVKLVEDASSSKAPIAKTADKVSGVFVPTVILVALLVFVVWISVTKNIEISLKHAISVLVISCPCALGLATPVAIMVGNGKGAKAGILFKTATALEQAGKADIVVLDKTGTITKGMPVVTDVKTLSSYSENELVLLAARLESGSEHPIASAVVNRAKELYGDEILPADSFENLSGHGVKGTLDGLDALIGNATLMQENDMLSPEAQEVGNEFSKQGKTPLFFALNGKIAGIIAVADEIKPDSAQAISALKKQGLRVIMLTGDNALSAKAVAEKCSVDAVISDVLPSDKDNVLSALKKYGKVIMVGDGINDAPALSRADIGIAIGAGTDIAIDSADIVLMKSSLSDVAKAINLSRRTLLNIKENLFWAFIYNVICIPIAAGALSFDPVNITLNPMIGAAAMSLSSVCVVLNALRLNLANLNKGSKRKKPPVDVDVEEVKAVVKNRKNQSESVATSPQSTQTETAIDFANGNCSTDESNRPDTCDTAQIETETDKNKGEYIMQKTISIEGMMCMHCVKHVNEALSKVDGVSLVEVSLENKNAIVTLTKDVSDSALKAAVENAGYDVTEIR